MRIFVDGYIFWIQRDGGVSRYWSQLLPKMAEMDRDIRFYLYLRPHTPDRISPASNITFLQRRSRLPAKVYSRWEKAILSRHLSKIQPDIFHSTYYTTVKSSRTRKVVTVYDTIYELLPHHFPPKADHLFARKKEVIASADTVIAISQNTKEDLISIYHLPEDEVEVIYPGIDTGTFRPEPNEESKRGFLETHALSRPYFLHVGRRMGYKNFQKLLEGFATSHFKDDFLLVAVGGEKELSKEEAETVEKYGLSNSVRFLKRMPTKELVLAYNNACALIVPSLYEGFGLSTLEAMASGCPVLASNRSSLPETVGDAGILFDPESTDDLVRTLEEATGSDVRRELRSKGLQRVTRFSWESTAAKMLTAYREAIDGT